MELNIGLLPLFVAALYIVIALYAQSALSELIDCVNGDAALRSEIGAVPDLYFIFGLSRLDYGFARYLWRHRQPPAQLRDRFPDYGELRWIAVLALAAHVALGVSIVAVVLIHRLMQ